MRPSFVLGQYDATSMSECMYGPSFVIVSLLYPYYRATMWWPLAACSRWPQSAATQVSSTKGAHYVTPGSQGITQPSTDGAQARLSSQFWWEGLFSCWYERSMSEMQMYRFTIFQAVCFLRGLPKCMIYCCLQAYVAPIYVWRGHGAIAAASRGLRVNILAYPLDNTTNGLCT